MSLCQSETMLGRAERVALCALRRALRGEAGTCTALVCPFGLGRDEGAVRRLFAGIAAEETLRPLFRGIGGWGANRTERRLLRALAAAQAENEQLLDCYLRLFAPSWSVRHRLAVAMEGLAATLAVHGYWLPQPGDLLSIPASALMLVRTKGHDVAMTQVVWPNRPA